MSSRLSLSTIYAADLYCGAGGASAGLHAAAESLGARLNLVAVNHWPIAVETHAANFPDALHLCNDVEKVEPRQAVPGGRLTLLTAGPSCTHFSQARGGKPVGDQQRSGAWEIVRWARELHIENILVENVPEFRTWGPVNPDGKPCKERKGMYFRQFLRMLRDLGYTVEYRVLNAAHYGDATTRKRLFIQARRSGRIVWPKPTHHAPEELAAFPGAQPWRAAREIIDWSIPGQSIFGRKRPLSINTMKRIAAGLKKFCGIPFLVPNFGEREKQAPRTHGIADPLPAVTSHGAGCLVEPFLVILRGTREEQIEKSAQGIGGPVPTICADGEHVGLCQPFVLVNRAHGSGPAGTCHGVDEPVRSLTTGNNMCLVTPFIIPQFSQQGARSVEDPLGTITTTSRGVGVVTPFLVPVGGPRGSQKERSVDEPLGTVLGQNHTGVVTPFLVRFNGPDGQDRSESLDAPLTTVDGSNRFGLCRPFLTPYYGTGTPSSVDEPLETVTTRDRFALIEPVIREALDKGDTLAVLDIHFRMLQPHELAAAHSFPADYKFAGGREDKVKQVGNSWPVRLSAALCTAILTGETGGAA